MNRKIKIIIITSHFSVTGISTVILNYCEALDKARYEFCIISGKPIAEANRKECVRQNINLIELPSRYNQTLKHYLGLWKVLKNNRYDIVHVHGNSPMMANELVLAKLAGAKIRIAHSHNKAPFNKWVYKVMKPIFKHSYTKGLACSELAGEWIFGEGNFQVLTNGFDTKTYKFNAECRLRIRKQLHIEECYVIGHVGRFNDQKNQPFLLEVFKEVAKKRFDVILLLVGTGPDFEKTQELVSVHPNKDRIILYGESAEMASLYSAMDVFVFPSKYEGLGLVAVEAQISGLPCIVSDVVPKEIVVGDNVRFIPLNEPVSTWANAIMNEFAPKESRKDFYSNNQSLILNYDMSHCVNSLEKIYCQTINDI